MDEFLEGLNGSAPALPRHSATIRLRRGMLREWVALVYPFGADSDGWKYGTAHPEEDVARGRAEAWCKDNGYALPKPPPGKKGAKP